MSLLVRHYLVGDHWAHGKVIELWVVCAAWVIVCFFAAYAAWKRGEG